MRRLRSRGHCDSMKKLTFQLASLGLEPLFFLLITSHCLPTGKGSSNNIPPLRSSLELKALSQPAPPLCWQGSCHLGHMPSPLLCDGASGRRHSLQLPIKGNPEKTASAICYRSSPSQSLATNNTWKEIGSCQGGLQRGWGGSVGTFYLASMLSAHSRS